jgi:hypothetical protein
MIDFGRSGSTETDSPAGMTFEAARQFEFEQDGLHGGRRKARLADELIDRDRNRRQ